MKAPISNTLHSICKQQDIQQSPPKITLWSMKLLSPFYWCIKCSSGEKLKRFASGHISFLRAQSFRAPSPMDVLIKTYTGVVPKFNSRSCWSWGMCEEKQISHSQFHQQGLLVGGWAGGCFALFFLSFNLLYIHLFWKVQTSITQYKSATMNILTAYESWNFLQFHLS